MTGQIAPTHRGNGGASGNLLFYLRKIIAYVETTHLFDDVEDIPFQGIKVSSVRGIIIRGINFLSFLNNYKPIFRLQKHSYFRFQPLHEKTKILTMI